MAACLLSTFSCNSITMALCLVSLFSFRSITMALCLLLFKEYCCNGQLLMLT
ncbi:hypothetical protein ZEAMMB73_Zm00001d041436 [Zea mays]|uniref:Uncharacterized protein n=1 Tax=Zea mays TaxID=4577 RepID=A0A1D6MW17_MAIZE|nr:hypothetical protein ZEAMMB73_Zm00001d041436 [Zea mays]